MIKERNQPLKINVHIYDIETDTEERKTQFDLRKVDVDLRRHTSFTTAYEEFKKQSEAVENKVQKMLKLLIWAMNNGKSVEFILEKDDHE